MRTRRPAALALAAVLVAGLGVAAWTQGPHEHVMRVALPGGGVDVIRYTGDRPPLALAARLPALAGSDGMAAAMDAGADALLRGTGQAALIAPDGALRLAAAAGAPAGSRSVSVSTVTVNGRSCTTRVETVSRGAGQAPRLLRRVSGDGCAAVGPAPAPPKPPAPPAPARPAADTV